MNKTEDNSNEVSFLKIIRWTARIFGTLFALFCFVFITFDMIEGVAKGPDAVALHWKFIQYALAISFISALAGLIIAIWKEGIGGLIAFSGMIFTFLCMIINPDTHFRYTFLIFLVPSTLYLLYWYLGKKQFKS